MSISVSISVGYERRRPDVRGDRWEARMDSLGLLLIGSTVVLVLVLLILPRVLAWLATL
jgi:hypothetical protein